MTDAELERVLDALVKGLDLLSGSLYRYSDEDARALKRDISRALVWIFAASARDEVVDV